MKDDILFGPEIDLRSTEYPLILFVGRSNVGKSSIIRLISGKKVRIGKKSGTTVIPIAIFMGSYWIIDMPGIGFSAKHSRSDSFKISKTVIDFIDRHKECAIYSFIIEDISSFPQIYLKLKSKNIEPISLLLFNYLRNFSKYTSIIMNKIDKLRKKERIEQLDFVSKVFGFERWVPRSHLIIPFSAKTKEGYYELKMLIDSFVNKKRKE